jgi:hypothetical protein
MFVCVYSVYPVGRRVIIINRAQAVNAAYCENHTQHTDTECRGLRLLGSLPVASYDSQGLRSKYS